MQPVFMSIDCEGTGMRIKKLIRENGYSVKDIQNTIDKKARRGSTWQLRKSAH